MKRLALVAKKGNTVAVDAAREIRERCTGAEVVAEQHLARTLGWPHEGDDHALLAKSDVVVVLGGDGTLIHAARLLAGAPVPILGVNLGSLGFMTEIPRAELFPTLDEVIAGRFQVERRMKLSCKLWRQGALIVEDEVLNDVVINKGALARITDHDMWIDGEFVTTYKSDGVIVSTPTGSTAYSLSAGGPIVHPTTHAVIVTPICPHSLTQRALLVPSDRSISISLRSDSVDVYLTIDGQAGHPLQTGDRLDVARSPNAVLLIRNPQRSYFSILRQKLHWGER